VAAALTEKEAFLEDWSGLDPSIFLAASTEEVRDDDTNACVAIFFFSFYHPRFCDQSGK
jgi:hypothetical protein